MSGSHNGTNGYFTERTFAVEIEAFAVNAAAALETARRSPVKRHLGQPSVVGRAVAHGDVHLAEFAVETRLTTALVSVGTVLAQAVVLARVRFAFVDVHFAVHTCNSPTHPLVSILYYYISESHFIQSAYPCLVNSLIDI